MKILDRFILKSFLGPFIMTFLIVIFTLVMQFLWLYIDELVGKGLSLGIIAEFLAWGSATLIPLALPLATLIASVMTMGNLGENNELLAMKAAGISLPRIIRPLTFVAVIISIGAFFASNNLIPVAYNKVATLREDIGRTKEEIKIPTGIFYNGIEGYTLRVVRNGENGKIYEVMVYDHSKNKGNISLTLADSGMIRLSSDKSGLIFTLYNGTSYEEDNVRNYSDTILDLNRVNFTEQEVVIPLKNYSFKKSDENQYDDAVRSKNLSQQIADKDSLTKAYKATLASQTRRAVINSSLQSSYQLDTNEKYRNMPLFALDSIYTDKKHKQLKWADEHEELQAVSMAINYLQEQVDYSEYYERELLQSGYYKRRSAVEIFRKFTLSFACLIFFFIGAPLGSIIRKGGLGTPIIVSALFFVFYWVIDISGVKLANDGTVGAFLGTFVSTLVLLPIGVFLTWKSTKDSALFNLDSYTNFFKNIAKKGYLKGQFAKWREIRRDRKESRKAAKAQQQ